MTRRRPLALLPLLLALWPAAAAAAPALGARALLDSVVVRYRGLAQYRFEGVVRATASGAALAEPQRAEMSFRYAAVRPAKLRNETVDSSLPNTVVADGESLWVWVPRLDQYMVRKAPVYVPGTEPSPAARDFDPVLYFVLAFERGIADARDLGTDTVATTGGPVRCRRIAVEFAPDTNRRAPRQLPRVLWIDEARRLVLRDSSTVETSHPQYGDLRQVQATRYALADVATPAPDSLFRFVPPAGARRVRRIGQSPQEDALAGKPAKDFSLAVFDGKGRKVSLAAQKGSVVVLDFWATWCGPCRRWMPVVAKLEAETQKQGVRFFAVNLHEDVADVRAYVTAQKVQVPVLLDVDGAVGTAYGARSIPLTVVIGRDGRVVRTLVGVHPEEDLRDALREAGVEGV